MKAREVSVSVSQFSDEVFVQVTLRLPGHVLARKPDGKVKESARNVKAKEIRKLLETVEFSDS